MTKIGTLALDADDTLWHTERLYVAAQAVLADLLSHYHSPEWITAELFKVETRNMAHYGYGIKAFALSMIETAVELSEGHVCGAEIRLLIEQARAMMDAPVELLPGVAETLPRLAERLPLIMITKGDLLDQERKLARSGLGPYFSAVEIVSSKSPESYRALLARHGAQPEAVMMVGNSLRSDVLPVLALGGCGVYIPYELTWQHEAADEPPPGTPGYYRIERFSDLPALLEKI